VIAAAQDHQLRAAPRVWEGWLLPALPFGIL